VFSPDGNIVICDDTTLIPADAFAAFYEPKLRLRLAGRGTDCLTLARISKAAGFDTVLQLIDKEDLETARTLGLTSVEKLTIPDALSDPHDDPWTAFVLMFHDSDWEVPLLMQALAGKAFYLGAVGSQRTQERRCQALLSEGADLEALSRIHGPIGLIQSMRDASMLALSALAEIVDAFHQRNKPTEQRTGFLLLAAGASSRFEQGDKLLADLDGSSVLDRSALLRTSLDAGAAYAVIAPGQNQRRDILEGHGWQVLVNESATLGQSSSLKMGLQALQKRPDIDQVVVLLADMPLVPRYHIRKLLEVTERAGSDAAMTRAGSTLCPPALFHRSVFSDLL
ncbi:MAG: NTP transferase domain-containing protein, partial [Pseudomonadota bacterium]